MQNQQIDSKLQQKIKALLAMAEGGTENEAAIAAQKLQEISIRHGIDIASVCGDEVIERDSFGDKDAKQKWKVYLACAIAGSNFCKAFTSGSSIAIVGKPQYVEISKSLYAYLVSSVERLCHEGVTKERNYYRNGEGPCLTEPNWTKWRNDFKRGCALRIVERIQSQLKEAKSNGVSDGSISAIVVQQAYVREAKEISAFLKSQGTHLTGGRRSSIRVGDGFAAGSSAGSRVGLNGQVGAGAGQRQLAGR